MPEENKTTNEEEVKETGSAEEVEEVKPKEEPGYVKIRTERAARQAAEEERKKLLAELGVESLDEARDKIQDGAKALEIASEVKMEIEAERQAKLDAIKQAKLKELYKDTFDPEVLVQLTNLEDVELDENGTIKESDKLLEHMKAARPRFFGTTTAQADKVATNTGGINSKSPMQQAYESGDYVRVVSEHLGDMFKK